MGEAKRRKLLDPNYGKPFIPFFEVHTQQEFFDKKTDIVFTSPYNLIPDFKAIDQEFGTKHWIFNPIPADQNTARAYFNEGRERILNSLAEGAQEFGAGWIFQGGYPKEDKTEFQYYPGVSKYLNLLENEMFTRKLGKSISLIIRGALKKWKWSSCVPVIATSMEEEENPIWIFIA